MFKTKKTSFKVLIVAILLVICALCYYFVFLNKNKPENTGETILYDSPTEQEIKEADDAKIERLDVNADKEEDKKSDEKPDSVVIKRLVYDTSISQLVVQTELDGTGWASCKITISNGDSTVEKESKAIYQSSFSTCLGFSIERSEFASSGTWNVNLSAQKNDGTSESTNASVSIP